MRPRRLETAQFKNQTVRKLRCLDSLRYQIGIAQHRRHHSPRKDDERQPAFGQPLETFRKPAESIARFLLSPRTIASPADSRTAAGRAQGVTFGPSGPSPDTIASPRDTRTSEQRHRSNSMSACRRSLQGERRIKHLRHHRHKAGKGLRPHSARQRQRRTHKC